MEDIQNSHRRIAAKMDGKNEDTASGKTVWQLQNSGPGFATRPKFAV
jgi:hypothetical protein